MMLPAIFLSCVFTAAPASISSENSNGIPPHPDHITFQPLDFEPPDPATFRRALSNGVPVYVAPSRELPLVNITFTFRGGRHLDPPDRIGLAAATGAMMRQGGTTSIPPSELDARFDELGAIADVMVGKASTVLTLNSLSSNFDEALVLCVDMLRNPAFAEERLGVWRAQTLERLRQRNDSPDAVLAREWGFLMYGRDHVEAAMETRASVEAISAADLQSMHRRIIHPAPENMVIAVSGDVNERNIIARLEHLLRGWAPGQPPPDPPEPPATFEPGVRYVDMDIPQGQVIIGTRSIRRDDPDYFPLLVLNEILGGGGFTSRITRRVRSEEGLAYDAGTSFSAPPWYPGVFVASFQSRNDTVALSIQIVLEEFSRIAAEPVRADELETARQSLIQTFPRLFDSPAAMLNVFVNDQLTGRSADYWQHYRAHISAVTADDIQRVARARLDAERVAVLIVGRWREIEPGDAAGRASMQTILGGHAREIPPRDPMTLQPLAH